MRKINYSSEPIINRGDLQASSFIRRLACNIKEKD